MTQHSPERRQMSLNEVAHLVQRQCGMSPHEAHDLLEDILTHVEERLQAIQTARRLRARQIISVRLTTDRMQHAKQKAKHIKQHSVLFHLMMYGRKYSPSERNTIGSFIGGCHILTCFIPLSHVPHLLQ